MTTTPGGHTVIDMPSDASNQGNNNNNNNNSHSTSTISIPVQTGPIYFLCSLSDFPPAQPPGATAVKKGKAVATGFDRLREAGFSEDEIRSIRRQFHASRGTVTSMVGENGIAVGLDQDEDASARARRIEEEWIDQHGAETLPEGLEGSYGEMVWGLMLGFFMGLIVMFWFKEATFSRRQQMGIIAGMMINIGFGVLHLYY
ncbi:hypothetical protein BGX33_006296 [Mortierella sp. NVP41]|nr:hypothetical protein BGX33_006296 [Mortierella sp. NVP41]